MKKNYSTLIEPAINAAKNSYSPYSKYKVGAAILTKNDNVFTGTNVENSSYGLTICAERIALFKAVSEGFKDFKAIAIASKDSAFPCGACRQALNEFNPDLIVIITDFKKKKIVETKLKDLLPHSFNL